MKKYAKLSLNYHQISSNTHLISSAGNMSASHARAPRSILSTRTFFVENFFPLPLIQEEQQAKEWTLNTDKLSPGGLPRNNLGK